jgi:PAS domain S-box-containing protein
MLLGGVILPTSSLDAREAPGVLKRARPSKSPSNMEMLSAHAVVRRALWFGTSFANAGTETAAAGSWWRRRRQYGMSDEYWSSSFEWLSGQIIDQSADAVVFCDRAGIIRLWNHGAERIFGHGSAEAVGRSLDLIIPESLRERHWAGYHGVMMAGVTRYDTKVLAVPAIRKDRSRISIEFTLTLIRDRGQLLGAAALIRDVTERWERDKALRRELARR